MGFPFLTIVLSLRLQASAASSQTGAAFVFVLFCFLFSFTTLLSSTVLFPFPFTFLLQPFALSTFNLASPSTPVDLHFFMFHPPADQVAATSPSLSFTTHTTASSIYKATYQHLTRTQAQEINTHVVLSNMLELCEAERSPSTPGSLPPPSPISVASGAGMSPSPPPFGPENLWIAGWSGPDNNRSLQIIVSLTQGQTGHHPLFVVDLEPGALDGPSVRTAMNQVAAILADQEPPVDGRVYAIFGPRRLAQALSDAWCIHTGATPLDDPIMDASYMECTRLSIRQAPTPLPGHRIREAGPNDVDIAANFCQSCSYYPYLLDAEAAHREARTLIGSGALFFYEVETGTEGYRATSMIAVGRRSVSVASITKVFTLPDFREMGYASRLLHHVCSHLLNEEGRSAVVSLVQFDNNPYKQLATRIGFDHTPSGNEEWLELGFENVNVGHW